MREMRDYQEKMLNSNKKIIICNWDRGKGKTYSIIKKIKNNKINKAVIVTNFKKSIVEEEIKKIKEIYTDKIIKVTQSDSLNNDFRGISNIDAIFFDEYIPSSKEINYLIEPTLKQNGQIFIMFNYKNIEYIEDEEDYVDKNTKTKEFNKLEVINKQIQELYEEYMSIEKTEKTTIRRDKVLMQIRMLEDMKLKYCKEGNVND